ncbi:glycosyltransferase family 1 protein [Spirosoma utsteinense]|uniref:Glycosyltransferase involved in cell wall biosynthesis n=1 Tax=Spirosoma utsteinense TaxID=2585773 RepID=A0ABR6W1P4_9BACT|nr:glycosyltransferase family 1 protein [Spirosoma utsteinense]MBC3785253.1 glycosyltransferase involved in cell wall biosynthesis [Spirosoma utsteinense]MBC3790521.1 glycosyltransferase involved in cell wall biosynthesis [Spirosoma utsteinense]
MDDLREIFVSPNKQRTETINVTSQLATPARPTATQSPSSATNEFDDLICFSHLRWNFVYQRPQHLLSRAAQRWRVWYIEEPEWSDAPGLSIRSVSPRLSVVVPQLPHGTSPEQAIELQRTLIDTLLAEQHIQQYALWYYTPMALPFSHHLRPQLTVYDCMDELSAFLGAPKPLLDQERQLMSRADLVFTGGYSLYEAKQQRHPQVFAFPSCIDYNHFSKARTSATASGLPDPADQQAIPGPRIGYSGVIDERLDLVLLGELARRNPNWQFVLLGPIVKINPDHLPKGPNLHYLGMKAYDELPTYFSNWQAAMMPFAINEATRYISPTKTPEYLAAGLPVVSTPIRDVLRTYGAWEQVVIADSVSAFESGLSAMLTGSANQDAEPAELDRFLRDQSWDNTWQQMQRILRSQLNSSARQRTSSTV